MTHLFAYTCNQPQHVARALEPLRHVLTSRGPVARWGFGYIQSDEVLLAHMPRPSEEDIDWVERLRDVRSGQVMGHAAEADGLRGPANTQPFRYRRWLFAQETATEARPGAYEEVLAQAIPDFLRRRIRGRTVGELVFNLLLFTLHQEHSIDAYDLPPRELARHVARTVATAEDAGLWPGNLMVTNGRALVAACVEQPLFVRRLTITPEDRQAHGFKGALLVSGAGQGEPGFEPIPARSLVLCHRDMTLELDRLES